MKAEVAAVAGAVAKGMAAAAEVAGANVSVKRTKNGDPDVMTGLDGAMMTDPEDVTMREVSDVETMTALDAGKMMTAQDVGMTMDQGDVKMMLTTGEASHVVSSSKHHRNAMYVGTGMTEVHVVVDLHVEKDDLTMKEDELITKDLGDEPAADPTAPPTNNVEEADVTVLIAEWVVIAEWTVIVVDHHAATEMSVAAVALVIGTAAAVEAGVTVLAADKIVMKEDHPEEMTGTGEAAAVMTLETGVGMDHQLDHPGVMTGAVTIGAPHRETTEAAKRKGVETKMAIGKLLASVKNAIVFQFNGLSLLQSPFLTDAYEMSHQEVLKVNVFSLHFDCC